MPSRLNAFRSNHILLWWYAALQGDEPELHHNHHDHTDSTLITVFYLQGHSPRDNEQNEGHDEDDDGTEGDNPRPSGLKLILKVFNPYNFRKTTILA